MKLDYKSPTAKIAPTFGTAGLQALAGLGILLVALGRCHPRLSLAGYSLYPPWTYELNQGMWQAGVSLLVMLSGWWFTRGLMALGPDGKRSAFLLRHGTGVLGVYLVVVIGSAAWAYGSAGSWAWPWSWDVASLLGLVSNFWIALGSSEPAYSLHVADLWLGALWPMSLLAQCCLLWTWLFRNGPRSGAVLLQLMLAGVGLWWMLSPPIHWLFGLDAFAAGSWVAWSLDRIEPAALKKIFRCSALVGGISIPLSVGLGYGNWPTPLSLDLLWAGLAGWMVVGAWDPGRSALGWLGRYGLGFCLIQVVLGMWVSTRWPYWATQRGLGMEKLIQYRLPVSLGLSLPASALLGGLLYGLGLKGRGWSASEVQTSPSGSAGKMWAGKTHQTGWFKSSAADRRFLLCAAATCVIVGIGAWVLNHQQRPQPPLPSIANWPLDSAKMFEPYGVNVFHLEWQLYGNPRAQRMAYQASCVLIGLSALAALLWRRLANRSRPTARGTTLAWLAVILGGGYFLWKCGLGVIAAGGMGLLVTALLVGPMLRGRWINRLLGIGAVALVAVMMLPLLLVRLDMSNLPWIAIDNSIVDYAGVVGLGDQLAQGFHLFRDVVPLYGVVFPLTLAVWTQHVGSLSMGQYVQIVEILQILYVGIAAWCCYKIGGRHRLVFLVVAFFIACNYEFNRLAWVLYPNHSAWRHIAFPLSVMAILLVWRKPQLWTSTVLGAVAAFAVLLNPEVGVAVTAGLAGFVFFQYFSRRSARGFKMFLALPGCFAVGVLVVLAAFALAYRLALGYWLDLSSAPNFLEHIRIVGKTGYGTMSVVPFNPLAILIFSHAALALIFAAAADGPATGPRNSLRAALSIMILVWFVYFANRPSFEYLYCYYVPYSFLLVDTLRTVAAVRRYRLSARSVAAFGAMLVVIGPVLQIQLTHAVPQYMEGLPTLWHPPSHSVISGVYLPDDARSVFVAEKAKFVGELGKQSPVLYLSADSYLIAKASGIWPAVPIFDPYGQAITASDYRDLLNSIIHGPFNELFIDDPASVVGGDSPGEEQFFAVLRRDLSRDFQHQDTQSGWERWVRR